MKNLLGSTCVAWLVAATSFAEGQLPDAGQHAVPLASATPATALDEADHARELSTRPLRVRGRVLLPDGGPAAGVIVGSSAGGRDVTCADGEYVLDLRVATEADALELTAKAAGLGGGLVARDVLRGFGQASTVFAQPLLLASSTGCEFEWLPTFGGQPGTTGRIAALAVFDDGSGPALYAGGFFSGIWGHPFTYLAKWDGREWSRVGRDLDGPVSALKVFDDGSGPALYVGGSFRHAGGQAVGSIAKWDGSSWSALGSGVSGGPPHQATWVSAMEVFDDGSGPALHVGGNFTVAGGAPAQFLAKWSGSGWSPFGGGVNGAVYTLRAHDDGTGSALFVGGGFSQIGGRTVGRIAKWDGLNWKTLGGGMNSWVISLEVFDAGEGPQLHAGGYFTTAGGASAERIARWDGSAWHPLGAGIYTPYGHINHVFVATLAVFDDGGGPALYAAGRFTHAGGQPAQRVAKWDGSSWSPLGAGMDWHFMGNAPNVAALHVFDAGSGPALYAGGLFGKAGDMPASGIARWNGSVWWPLGRSGLDRPVHALAADPSTSTLYAGGDIRAAGGQAARNVAAWKDGWSPLGDGMPFSVRALALFDAGLGPELFAAGSATISFPLAWMLGRWTQGQWVPVGSGLDGDGQYVIRLSALAVYDDGAGPGLYAGGNPWIFNTPSFGVLRWTPGGWLPLNSGVFDHALALAVYDDGLGGGPALYAGGNFTWAGGQQVAHIAKWDGAGWSPLGSGVGGSVAALAVFDDGSGPALYVGGYFSTAGGLPASRLARWNGLGWSAVGGGTNAGVHALAAFDGGASGKPALYVGGDFTAAGDLAVGHIAAWDGVAWSALSSGVDGTVRALTILEGEAGPSVVAGGDFNTSPAGDSYVARWGCPSSSSE